MKNLKNLRSLFSFVTIFSLTYFTCLSSYAAPITLNHGGLAEPDTQISSFTTEIDQIADDGDVVVTNNTGSNNGINIDGVIRTDNNNLSVTNIAGNVTVLGGISTTSGDLDFTNGAISGTTAANVNLGSNNSSSVTLNGGALVGNVVMNNANQILTFSGGSLTGDIAGSGTVEVSENITSTILNGDIVATSVNLGANSSLNNSINDNNITSNINLASGSLLTFGNGSITGNVAGSGGTNGSVLFNENTTTSAVIGGDNTDNINSVNSVALNSNVTVNLNSNLQSSNLTLNSGSQLNLGVNTTIHSNIAINEDSVITLNGNGSIRGDVSGVGSINTTAGKFSAIQGTIGENNNKLTAINVASGSTLASFGTINSNQVNLVSSSVLSLNQDIVVNSDIRSGTTASSGNGLGEVIINGDNIDLNGDIGSANRYISKLTINTDKTLVLDGSGNNDVYTDSVKIANNSTLVVSSSTLKATSGINGEGLNQGNLNLASNRTLSSSDFNIGNNTAISNLTISNNSAVQTSGSYDIRANTVTIEAGGESLTLANGGSITGSAVSVGNGSSLNVNQNTSVSGVINGASSNQGSLSVDGANFQTSAAIGTTNKLNSVSLEEGATFATNHNVVATNVTLKQNSVLNVNAGNISGVINGQAGGNEVINFNATSVLNNNSTTTTIGSNIEDVNIANGADVTTSVNIDAANLDVGAGASGSLTIADNVTVSSNVNVNSGAQVNLGGGVNLGVVNGSSAGVGTLELQAGKTFTQQSVIGNSNALSNINLGEGATFNNNGNNIATNQLNLASNASLNLDGGSFVGTIRGTDNNNGVLNISSDLETSSSGARIGESGNAVGSVVVDSSEVVVGESIYVGSIRASDNQDSVIRVSENKEINGRVLLDGAGSIILNDNSSVTGNIQGNNENEGLVNIASGATYQMLGDIGTVDNGNDRFVQTVQVSDGATLANGEHDINVDDIDGEIIIGDSATLEVGAGSISGKLIQGSSAGKGDLVFTSNNTVSDGTLIGVGGNSLNSIKVTSGNEVTLEDSFSATTVEVGSITNLPQQIQQQNLVGNQQDINTSLTIASGKTGTGDITLFSNGQLNILNNASVQGTINGSADNSGIVSITGNVNLNDEVGDTHSLEQVIVGNSSTLDTQGFSMSAGKVLLNAADSTLVTSGEGTVNFVVEALEDGFGIVEISQDSNLSESAIIGSEAKSIARLLVSADAELEVSSNGSINANEVILEEGSILVLNNNSHIVGDIEGNNNIEGNLVVANNATFTTAGTIGDENALFSIAVGDGAIFNMEDSAAAVTFTAQNNSVVNLRGNTVSGAFNANSARVNFGNDNSVVNGNFTSNGTSIIDLGSGQHDVTGDLSLAAGNTLRTTGAEDGFGKIVVDGAATIASGASLGVTIDSRIAYNSVGSNIVIVDGGNDSSLNTIADDKIDVNAAGNNVLGLLTFSTAVSGNDLIVNVTKAKAAEVVQNSDSQQAYTALDQAGNNSVGTLRTVQNFIFLDNNATAQQRTDVIDSITQNDVGSNQALFSSTSASINIIEDRISSISLSPLASSKPSYLVTDAKGNKVKGLDKSASANSSSYGNDGRYVADKIGRSLWAQVLGSTAKQDNKKGFNGFDAKTYGLTFGIDQKLDEDVLVGAALSINNTQVDSSNGLKKVEIDSYQLTLYGEKRFDEYFVDGFVSGALNRFESDRIIPLVGRVASANYDGYSLSTKFRAGYVNRLDNGLDVIPQVGLLYSYNSSTDYQEDGADTTNLIVSNNSSELLIGDVGVAVAYDSEAFGYNIRPQFKLSYGFDFIGNQQISSASFIGQGAIINASNSKSDRNIIRFGAGTDIYAADQFTLNASYLFEYRDTYESHIGALKAKYSF